MKNILLLILFCFIGGKIFSQDLRDRGFLSFTVGYTQKIINDSPINLYTTGTKYNGNRIGIENGSVVSGTFGYSFLSNVGLSVSLQRIRFSANKDSTLFRGWVIESAVAGPYLTFDMGENVKLDLRFLLGYMRMTTPVYGKNSLFVTRIFDGEGMAYQIAIASRVPVSKKISLIFSTDYYSAKPAWQIGSEEIEEKISAINFNFGMAGRLWK
jgi:hypothetical protein